MELFPRAVAGRENTRLVRVLSAQGRCRRSRVELCSRRLTQACVANCSQAVLPLVIAEHYHFIIDALVT